VEYDDEFQTRACKINQEYSVYQEEYGKRERNHQKEEITVPVL